MESAVIRFLWINGIQFMSGKQHHVAGWCHMAADSDAEHMEASVRTQNSPALFIRCLCDHKQLVYRLYDLSVFIFLFYI